MDGIWGVFFGRAYHGMRLGFVQGPHDRPRNLDLVPLGFLLL